MDIKILHLRQGACESIGLTVVIDVFRAFSTACYVMANGARRIIPAGSVEEALRLKQDYKGAILIGERSERKCEGFDYGNSPTHLLKVDLTGKTVIQTTSAGTLGLVSASRATTRLTGSFVNAEAIVQYIIQEQPAVVSLVAMGYNAERPSQEDTACAEWIRNRLEGKTNSFGPIVERLRTGDGARLLDPVNHLHSPATDFDLCLDLNRFNFVLKVQTGPEGRPELVKCYPE